MKEKDLYRLALVTLGPEAQTLMVMEKIGVIGINCGIEGSRQRRKILRKIVGLKEVGYE